MPSATQADHSIALDNKVLSTQSSGIFSIFDSPFRRMSPEMSLAMLPAYYVRHYVRHGYSFPTIRKDANVSDVFSPFAKVRTRIVPVQPHNTFATAVSEYLLDCYHKTVWFFWFFAPPVKWRQLGFGVVCCFPEAYTVLVWMLHFPMAEVDVEIATPEIIVSVYLLLFVPLAMAWAYFVHYGCKDRVFLYELVLIRTLLVVQ